MRLLIQIHRHASSTPGTANLAINGGVLCWHRDFQIAAIVRIIQHRVLDIGHIDMEYEMFLRKQDKQVKVAHKYFNEINERNPIECTDEGYLSQIVAIVK